jgi:hypothetical protein
MIHTWIVPIMGFTQTFDRPTGMEKLWGTLRKYSGPRCCVVAPMEWDEDFQALAGFIGRNSDQTKPTTIITIAYSWGAGNGFIKLADALAALPVPLRIERAILADPVYHPGLAPFAWRALVNGLFAPKIAIPANVGRVSWTRQERDKPRAHDLVAADPAPYSTTLGTIIDAPKLRPLNHNQMDDDPTFHRMALAAVKEVLV